MWTGGKESDCVTFVNEEDKLIPNQYKEYEKHLYDYEDGNKTGYRWHATWQQRVVALAKVKGIKI